jgi:hypothetical protein
MALTEAEKATLIDNQFAYDGNAAGAEYVRHLPCDKGIYLGEPPEVEKVIEEHLAECASPDGLANTYRGNRPWPKGTPSQEAKKEEWLDSIESHAQTTEKDLNAAVSLLIDPTPLPIEQANIENLEKFGFVIVNPDGSVAAKDASW